MVGIIESINRARRDLLVNEQVMTNQLSLAYLTTWRSIERKLDQIQMYLDIAATSGETVDEAWLNEQLWYLQLQESIRIEFERFNLNAAQILGTTQSSAVFVSEQVTSELRRSLGEQFAGRVNANGFARWVSAIQPGSPLTGVIKRYGDRVGETITRSMHEGITRGLGSRTIVRNIHRDIGPDAVTPRIETLVRTEIMRAYRGAQRDDIETLAGDDQAGWEWEWLSARGARTCAACLAMDGQRFPFDQYPNRFHCSCRCVVRVVPPADLVPARGKPRQTGELWLRGQPAAVQKRIMRTPAAYNAFRDGEPLINFVGIRRNEQWGDSIYVKSAKEVTSSKPFSIPKRTRKAA